MIQKTKDYMHVLGQNCKKETLKLVNLTDNSTFIKSFASSLTALIIHIFI